MDFYKSVVLKPRSYKKRDVKDINARLQHEFGNPDIYFDRDEKIDKDRVLKNIESLFEDSKSKMTGKSSEDNFPFFVYLTKTFSDYGEMAEGGMFKITNLSEEKAGSFLKWLFHHDFYHVIEKFLGGSSARHIQNIKRNSISEFEDREYFNYIKIKGLEGSLYNLDNRASVVPNILTKSQEEAKSFLEENYVEYEEYLEHIDTLRKKNTHRTFTEMSSSEYYSLKGKNIASILEELITIKDSFNILFDELKDYIIVASYEISGLSTVEPEEIEDNLKNEKYTYYQNLSYDNYDRIVDYAIKTENSEILYDVLLSTWSKGFFSKETQLKIVNMSSSNKAFTYTDYKGETVYIIACC